MSYLDTKYINLASASLQKYKKVKTGLYTFRCPYCGDSKKNKNKTRGYLFQVKGDHVFKCHNCGITRSFSNFLKDHAPHVYDEYVMERYKEGTIGKNVPKPDLTQFVSKPTFTKRTVNLETLSSLNNFHVAKKYILDRGIPENKLDRLYYCPNFKEWSNTQKQTFSDTTNDEARIIIPLNDTDGNLIGFQGRSLSPNAKMRYITVMLDENAPKLYGLDHINKNETIYIVEGPLDSFFLENSVAMCGSDVDIRTLGWSDYIWVYDNEPRSRQITDKISKSIDAGDSVVIWPSTIKEKDLNDMVVSGVNVKNVIQSNVYQGLKAKLQLSNWKI
ncbi:DNA primase subunit [Prochlorococcus phage P-HM2]|uniref:DNA primase subunit n=1 Tax=Prochlorococcus phage P-HM2 TaxID=445696 RepID=E3ST24_9CAUD|nr:DNA primase [Prochlorococcus phage P-HM2]ADO99952.1 DNA primase subunit [Prochlorococcus phage P-HM2]